MTREQELVGTFVGLADTLVEDYDIIDFMQTLAERCVDLLDVSAAGIMLADSDGRLHHAACSSEQKRLVELFEIQIEKGPCFDAYRERTSVQSASPEEAEALWPQFAPRALESGFVSFSAVPMRLRAKVIGALNLFSSRQQALVDRDLDIAQAMADIATIGILQERAIRDHSVYSSQLQVALSSRIAIEQAKGVVAERNHISVDQAFEIIRSFTRSHHRALSDTARRIVDGTLSVDELAVAGAKRAKAPPPLS